MSAAMQQRTRNGWYWTGDLGYKDERGYLYFAGRDVEWLRVDGENFVGRPIEEILHRHPDIVVAAVYGVPDAEGGDRVMAAVRCLMKFSRFATNTAIRSHVQPEGNDEKAHLRRPLLRNNIHWLQA